jgi:hypothetical protein
VLNKKYREKTFSIVGKQINFIVILRASMRKSEELNNAALSRIAISAILVASFIFAGSQFSQQTLAIHEGNATGTATLTQSQLAGGGGAATQNQTDGGAATQSQLAGGGGAATQNQTDGGAAAAAAAAPTTTQTGMQEPPLNRPFTWQGTVSSESRPIEGTEDGEQLAVILPPRNDGGVYSGVLTFSSSKPIQVEVWHEYDPGNTTGIPEVFGTEQIISSRGKEYATSLIEPGAEGALSATVPFSGNAIALNGGGEEFIATYSLTAGATQPRTINNVESIATVAAEEEAAGDEEDEGAAGEEEDEGAAGGAEEEDEGATEAAGGAEEEDEGATEAAGGAQ